jgi:hypothetical protein
VKFDLPASEEEESVIGGDNFTSQMMSTALFELYLALHEFCKYKESLPSR